MKSSRPAVYYVMDDRNHLVSIHLSIITAKEQAEKWVRCVREHMLVLNVVRDDYGIISAKRVYKATRPSDHKLSPDEIEKLRRMQ